MPPAPVNTARTLLLLTVGVGACDTLGRFVSETRQDRLAEAALAAWASPGHPFFDGTSGPDTVASVTPTGARAWEVAVVPPSGGMPVVWSLEISRIEVYPFFPGDVFISWLEERAGALGMRATFPEDVVSDVRRGDIRGLGDIEVRCGPSDASAPDAFERVAYLTPVFATDSTEWRIQPESDSSARLAEAVKLVADEMIHRDVDVLSCMGGAPESVGRGVQLRCLSEALTRRFGERQP